MSEIVLIIVVFVLLVGVPFLLNQVKAPLRIYIKVAMAIGLLLLLWLSKTDSSPAIRILLSVLVLFPVLKEVLSLRKSRPEA